VKEFIEKYLNNISLIRMVGITGSVAANNAKNNDDIDLLLVCLPNSLWLTRLWVWLLVRIKNIPHRKYGQIEGKDEFCFNLWLETDSLKLPLTKQNRKNAIDMVMMKIILDKDNVFQEMLHQNIWVKYFCANGFWSRKKINNFKKKKTSIWIFILNFLAYIFQIGYIKLKGNKKYIKRKQTFFHGI
jgi:adenine-specific DNA methylase